MSREQHTYQEHLDLAAHHNAEADYVWSMWVNATGDDKAERWQEVVFHQMTAQYHATMAVALRTR